MQVNLVTSQQSIKRQQPPNFKGVSIVQVPKRVFKNPENIGECTSIFDRTVCRFVKDKMQGLFAEILALFTLKPHKVFVMLEPASYRMTKNAMQQQGLNYSISWATQNTGLPIRKPLNKDYHSFYIFTKEHKDRVMTDIKTSMSALYNLLLEGCKKYTGNRKLAIIYSFAKLGTDADKEFDAIMASTTVKKFTVESLDEIKNIVKDFDV